MHPTQQMDQETTNAIEYERALERQQWGLAPAPLKWRAFPLELVRLLEETYDIVSEGGLIEPDWDVLMDLMTVWMPGIGIQSWLSYEFPGLKRMKAHIRDYVEAGMPLDGVLPKYARSERPLSTTCRAGHPMTGDNVYTRGTTGRRECRTCCRIRVERRTSRKAGTK